MSALSYLQLARLGDDGTVGGINGSPINPDILAAAGGGNGNGGGTVTLPTGTVVASNPVVTGYTLIGSSTPNAFPSVPVFDYLARPGENPLSDDGNWVVFTGFIGSIGGSAGQQIKIATSGQATSNEAGPVNAPTTYAAALFIGENSPDQDFMFPLALFGGAEVVDIFFRVPSATATTGFYRIKFEPTICVLYRDSTSLKQVSGVFNQADSVGGRMAGNMLSAYHQVEGSSDINEVVSISDSTYTEGYSGFAVSSSSAVVGPITVGAVVATETASWQPNTAGIQAGTGDISGTNQAPKVLTSNGLSILTSGLLGTVGGLPELDQSGQTQYEYLPISAQSQTLDVASRESVTAIKESLTVQSLLYDQQDSTMFGIDGVSKVSASSFSDQPTTLTLYSCATVDGSYVTDATAASGSVIGSIYKCELKETVPSNRYFYVVEANTGSDDMTNNVLMLFRKSMMLT